MKEILTQILMWPQEDLARACQARRWQDYMPLVAAIGVPYYLYGMPSMDGGVQALAMWYGVAGLSSAVADMIYPPLAFQALDPRKASSSY